MQTTAEITELYSKVAAAFATRIRSIFATEATLEEAFKLYFPSLPFERTDHWNIILRREFSLVWQEHGPAVKSEPTQVDVQMMLRTLHKYLDFNLFTQVLLNLQSYLSFTYSVMDAKREIEEMQAQYEGKEPSPFAPKAKMIKMATSETDKKYNVDLSTLKALRIIEQFAPGLSFRVSPTGTTPAFADSKNLSMIGVGGDRFLRTMPTLMPYYITWAPGTTPFIIEQQKEGDFLCEDVRYVSKSGGEILNEVLFARKLTHWLFSQLDTVTSVNVLLPRMNSILIVSSAHSPHLREAYERIKNMYPVLEFHEGTRV